MLLPNWLRFRPIYLWAVIWAGIVVLILYQMSLFGGVGGGDIESTSIRPEADGVAMSADGVFTGVFSNHVGGPVTIKRVVLIDEGNRSLACGTNKTMDLPVGGIFRTEITGCGARNSGDGFEVNVRIDYDKNVAGKMVAASEIGILGGVVE